MANQQTIIQKASTESQPQNLLGPDESLPQGRNPGPSTQKTHQHKQEENSTGLSNAYTACVFGLQFTFEASHSGDLRTLISSASLEGF